MCGPKVGPSAIWLGLDDRNTPRIVCGCGQVVHGRWSHLPFQVAGLPTLQADAAFRHPCEAGHAFNTAKDRSTMKEKLRLLVANERRRCSFTWTGGRYRQTSKVVEGQRRQ